MTTNEMARLLLLVTQQSGSFDGAAAAYLAQRAAEAIARRFTNDRDQLAAIGDAARVFPAVESVLRRRHGGYILRSEVLSSVSSESICGVFPFC